MQLHIRHLVSPAIAVTAVAALAIGGGTAYAVAKIDGADIKKKSIAANKLTPEARATLKGAQGPKGAPGTPGVQGAPGAAGSSYVGTFTTTGGLVPVAAGNLYDQGPTRTGDGGATILEFELDQGEYVIDGTAQFFHLTPGTPVAATDYGVISVFVEGSDASAKIWTADIPDGGANINGAQTNASTYVNIPADDTTVTVRAAVNSSVPGNGAQAGASLLVTEVVSAG